MSCNLRRPNRAVQPVANRGQRTRDIDTRSRSKRSIARSFVRLFAVRADDDDDNVVMKERGHEYAYVYIYLIDSLIH